MEIVTADVTRELEQSIGELRETEEYLVTCIGHQRVEELREFWLAEFNVNDLAEFLQESTYRERLLIGTWTRLQRVSSLHVIVCREHMKRNVITGQSRNLPKNDKDNIK